MVLGGISRCWRGREKGEEGGQAVLVAREDLNWR